MDKALGYGIVVLWLKRWATELCVMVKVLGDGIVCYGYRVGLRNRGVMVKALGYGIVVLWLKRGATESWCYG